jgi:hypothetical protein
MFYVWLGIIFEKGRQGNNQRCSRKKKEKKGRKGEEEKKEGTDQERPVQMGQPGRYNRRGGAGMTGLGWPVLLAVNDDLLRTPAKGRYYRVGLAGTTGKPRSVLLQVVPAMVPARGPSSR